MGRTYLSPENQCRAEWSLDFFSFVHLSISIQLIRLGPLPSVLFCTCYAYDSPTFLTSVKLYEGLRNDQEIPAEENC